jgi:hypothetical protein
MLKKKKKTILDREDDIVIDLPTENSKPSTNIGDYTFLIYGEKKIGKTSLASRFPDTLMCMFEPGGKALSIKQIEIPTWAHFRKLNEKLDEDGHDYDTICIDTGAIAFDKCQEYVCIKNEFSHPSDEAYGKGWKKLSDEFNSQITKSMMHGTGYIVLAHNKEKEITTASGKKFQCICPQLPSGAENFFTATVDIIAYYFYEGSQRWLQIRGDDYIVAGCRPEKNFIAKDGFPIHKIPMGNTPDEAYKNLMNAFQNKQENSYRPEGGLIKKKIARKPIQ